MYISTRVLRERVRRITVWAFALIGGQKLAPAVSWRPEMFEHPWILGEGKMRVCACVSRNFTRRVTNI